MTQPQEGIKAHTRNSHLQVHEAVDALLVNLIDELRALFMEVPHLLFCKVTAHDGSVLKADNFETLEEWVWKQDDIHRLHLSITSQDDSLVLNVVGPRSQDPSLSSEQQRREAQLSVSSSSASRVERIFERIQRVLGGGPGSGIYGPPRPERTVVRADPEGVLEAESGAMDSRLVVYSVGKALHAPPLPPSALCEVYRRARGQHYTWLELSHLAPLFVRPTDTAPYFYVRVRGQEEQRSGTPEVLEGSLSGGGTVEAVRMVLHPRLPDGMSATLSISRAEGTSLHVLGIHESEVRAWADELWSRIRLVPRRSPRLAQTFVLARAVLIAALCFLTLRLGLRLGISSEGGVAALAMLCGLIGLVVGGWLRIQYRRLWPEAFLELQDTGRSQRRPVVYTVLIGLVLPALCLTLGLAL